MKHRTSSSCPRSCCNRPGETLLPGDKNPLRQRPGGPILVGVTAFGTHDSTRILSLTFDTDYKIKRSRRTPASTRYDGFPYLPICWLAGPLHSIYYATGQAVVVSGVLPRYLAHR